MISDRSDRCSEMKQTLLGDHMSKCQAWKYWDLNKKQAGIFQIDFSEVFAIILNDTKIQKTIVLHLW